MDRTYKDIMALPFARDPCFLHLCFAGVIMLAWCCDLFLVDRRLEREEATRHQAANGPKLHCIAGVPLKHWTRMWLQLWMMRTSHDFPFAVQDSVISTVWDQEIKKQSFPCTCGHHLNMTCYIWCTYICCCYFK